MNDRGKQMVQLISDFDPHVVILGGDIAYDNGMKNCYYNWDIFYKMFEPVYEKLGRLVPLVMSIGNHDAGFDSLYNISLDKR